MQWQSKGRLNMDQYPITVRRIVLIGVKNGLASAPPRPALQEWLAPLLRHLSELVRFFLNAGALERSEEDFGLGLDALEVLSWLADPNALELVRLAMGVPRRWIRRHLNDSCRQALVAWRRSAPSDPQYIERIESALKMLSGESQID
ncbi:MAG: hypothetical protein ABSG53_25465 [Thermoguttaceae bacterium]|jgi:hypothetical protein